MDEPAGPCPAYTDSQPSTLRQRWYTFAWRWLRSPPVLMLIAGLIAIIVLDRQLSGSWFVFGTHPEVRQLLEQSLADQKALAGTDPEHTEQFRNRFTTIQQSLNRIRIIEHNRTRIVRRFEAVIVTLLGSVILLGGVVSIVRQHREERRLGRLRQALADLSAGCTDLDLGDHRSDPIGRVARMIEQTSLVVGHERRRLAALDNLRAWQEMARRQAHEMRTPLTAARLTLTQLDDQLGAVNEGHSGRQAVDSVIEEIDRLARFTNQFTAFARLPEPRPQLIDLGQYLQEFVETFGCAWPQLSVRLHRPDQTMPAAVDGEMLRQALTNLFDNSAHAVADSGSVAIAVARHGGRVAIDIVDDGCGVADSIRSRLFEPYVTTRTIGEGTGLGLAIAKKIMLDHGGDLELLNTSDQGTTMRLTFASQIEVDP
jgi:signal transduction histidine kinase